uniref:Uncharacterized protein n=1 Tax=Salix viminalis TaxID=40686 RepID=A0A6N2N2W2_SALVM
MALAMVAEDQQINDVLKELFAEEPTLASREKLKHLLTIFNPFPPQKKQLASCVLYASSRKLFLFVTHSIIRQGSESVTLLGNELQIRQANLYVFEGEELSFYEVLLRARQRREIVIGYLVSKAERAVINPTAKSERRRWSLEDAFVVIAEKEWE